MITSRLTDSGVLIVQPSGPITKEDFSTLADEVDPWLESGGDLKGLLIDAPEFPGWKDFGGLGSHLKFVRGHHRRIPRIAIVSDSRFLGALPKVARHFVQADLQHFDAGETAAALTWIESPREEPTSSIRQAWFPGENLLWIAIDGKVTTDDYRGLRSFMEGILAETTPISILVDIDDLEGVELGAMMADLKFGLVHLKDIRRLALVGDEKWIRRLAALPNPFSLEIRAFSEADEYEAWHWLTA